MPTLRLEHLGYAALVATGVAIGWGIWGRQGLEVRETYAPAVIHDDGSVTGERLEGGKPTQPAPTTPDGETTRALELRVQPTVPPVATDTTPAECREVADTFRCPTLDLRIDETRLDDGTHRFSAHTPDGEILAFKDFALAPAVVQRTHALGVAGFTDGSAIVRYARTTGRLELSVLLAAPDGVSAGIWVPGAGVDYKW